MLEVSTDNGTHGQRPPPASLALPTGPTCSGRPSRMRRGTPRRRRHQTVTIDATAPTAGTLSLTGFTDTGSSSSDGLSNDNAFSLSLTGSESGSTSVLEVSTDNGTTWTTTTASQSGLADGTYLFRATVTDAAGNVSTTATQTVTIDTTAPTAGTLSLTGFTDTGSSSSMASRTTTPSASASPAVSRARTRCSRSRRITASPGPPLRRASPAWRTGPTCPGHRHRCGGECLHHRHQTVTIDTTAPTAGTLSLTGFTDTGLRPPMAVERQHLQPQPHRQRGRLDLRARGLDG